MVATLRGGAHSEGRASPLALASRRAIIDGGLLVGVLNAVLYVGRRGIIIAPQNGDSGNSPAAMMSLAVLSLSLLRIYPKLFRPTSLAPRYPLPPRLLHCCIQYIMCVPSDTQLEAVAVASARPSSLIFCPARIRHLLLYPAGWLKLPTEVGRYRGREVASSLQSVWVWAHPHHITQKITPSSSSCSWHGSCRSACIDT